MAQTRIAINGAGRIGRAFLKIAYNRKDLEVVAINDLGNIDNIAYLLKYDSVYGPAQFPIAVREDKKAIIVGDKEILFLSEKEPAKLPWQDLKIDVVAESTGFFTTYEGSRAHLEAGAKKVVISAPAKDAPLTDVVSRTILL